MSENVSQTANASKSADAQSEPNAHDAGPATSTVPAVVTPPSYQFMGIIAACVVVADALTKSWAETTLSRLTRLEPSRVLIDDVLTLTLAYNKGGAFGMLAGEQDAWRRPFFLLVSAGASLFIVSLYRRVQPKQWALRWGLPLVLGGALGNFADRLAKGKVVDFVDYRAGWVETMNELIAKVNPSWHVTSHWPTFNLADVSICVGVGLMVVDMFTAGAQPRKPKDATHTPASAS